MRVQTQAVHFTADSKLLEFIEEKLGKLDHFFDRILEAQVILKLENSGQVKEKVVEVKLMVPGEILFAKESNKTFENATDKVVDTLKRQILKHKDKIRQRS